MTTYNELVGEAQKFLEEVTAFDAKPTKASSKRLRDSINSMKKLATQAKKDLIDNDANLGKPKA
jgi:hypothetical protein